MAITLEEVINSINKVLAEKAQLEQKIIQLEAELASLKKTVKLKAVPKEDSSYT